MRVQAYCSSVAPLAGVVAVDRADQRLEAAGEEVLDLALRRHLAHLAVDDVADHRQEHEDQPVARLALAGPRWYSCQIARTSSALARAPRPAPWLVVCILLPARLSRSGEGTHPCSPAEAPVVNSNGTYFASVAETPPRSGQRFPARASAREARAGIHRCKAAVARVTTGPRRPRSSDARARALWRGRARTQCGELPEDRLKVFVDGVDHRLRDANARRPRERAARAVFREKTHHELAVCTTHRSERH